uniref:ShKT domain-containing protein n=1 Tax=Syphacia muris TaxID=451379 RepID=A0A0N5AGM7_9BILA
ESGTIAPSIKTASANSNSQPLTINPVEPLQRKNNPYECMTLNCLCPFFEGHLNRRNQCILKNGEILQMALRKEYRMLSDDERQRFHAALNILKRSGEYDRLSAQHQSVGTGSGAHSGPGFLPWHREYLKRFEIAIRLLDPTLAIPYWDSVLDNYIADPRDSIVFTPPFFGETDYFGNVVTGPFAYWHCLDGRSAIWRNMAREGGLFTEQNINSVMAQTNVEFVLAYTAPFQGCPLASNYYAIEYTHSNIHLWIGGHMKPPPSSSNDPVFYLHHSFVDFIWEMWRQTRQSRREYPRDIPQCADPQHFSYSLMRPFYNLANRDGLSNMYTDFMYRYKSRPTCTIQHPFCNSSYLFCDVRIRPHCVTKIKLGGNCRGFRGIDACYKSICQNDHCIPGIFNSKVEVCRSNFSSTFDRFEDLSFRNAKQIVQMSSVISSFNCYNRNPCCNKWSAIGYCNKNRKFQKYCPVSCKICQPMFNVRSECTDRYLQCSSWKSSGHCTGNSSHFMAENCRFSCNLCHQSKSLKCSTYLNSKVSNTCII